MRLNEIAEESLKLVIEHFRTKDERMGIKLDQVYDYLKEDKTKLPYNIIFGLFRYLFLTLEEKKLNQFLKEDFTKIISYLESQHDFIYLKPSKYITQSVAGLLVVCYNDYTTQCK